MLNLNFFKATTIACVLALGATLSATLSGCGGDDAPKPNTTLTLLHTNDHHSYLDGAAYDLTIGGEAVRVQLGGMSRVAGAIKAMKNDHSIVLNSGELNGTLYFSLFKGKADFDVFNEMGLDAYEIGNHEFDEGEATLAELIKRAKFPILGAMFSPRRPARCMAPHCARTSSKKCRAKRLASLACSKSPRRWARRW